ncbi:MAG: ATP-dependent helicase HrpB [Pseudomonadales bacterium]
MPAEDLQQLPIQDVIPDLLTALQHADQAVLEAPPGAGKTTAVPLALLSQPWLADQKILLLQPRRIAAKGAATRLADNLGESVGETVGYRMRLDTKVSANTRLEVITEGILTRMLQHDPSLEGIGLIIFDEFHERSLNNDLNLALSLQCRELLRDDLPLKLLIMSATLDSQASRNILQDAPIIHSRGQSFPVDIVYSAKPNARAADKSLEERVQQLCQHALKQHPGDILVFLPGQREIERSQLRLEQALLPGTASVLPLYANLPLAQQQMAIAPSGQLRKIILATNIAETSITLPGIKVVIDSGLCRRAIYDVNTGTTRLSTQQVSRASSVQRAGRAGRTSPGTCYRMWSEDQQQSLAPFETPQIRNADLSGLMLNLVQWGCSDAAELHWLDPPSQSAQQQALDSLHQLQAVKGAPNYQLTTLGEQLCQLPLSPKLALICVRGAQWGQLTLACDLAALLSEGNNPEPLARQFSALAKASDRHYKRIATLSRDYRRHCAQVPVLQALTLPADDIISLLIAAAWPERIAQLRGPELGYKLANGRSAHPANGAHIRDEYLAVAHCGGIQGRDNDVIQLACALNIDHLKQHLSILLQKRDTLHWDAQAQRFIAERQLYTGELILACSALQQIDIAHKRELLLDVIYSEGLAVLNWCEQSVLLCARVNLLHDHCSEESGWPDLSDRWLRDNLKQWLAPHLSDEFVHKLNHLKGLKKLNLLPTLQALLPWPLSHELDTHAPLKLSVPSGSRIAIDYSQHPPVLAVKLQEMFGSKQTPVIADQCRAKASSSRGIPLLLHLLSPAGRPLQITQDLAHFWSSSYFEVQREMKGRYPKHPWPDEPMNFTPTRKTKAALERTK